MRITVNNKETELKDYESINVTDLLQELGFTTTIIMVKVNDQLIKKAEQGDFLINPGDQVIAVPLVGGG